MSERFLQVKTKNLVDDVIFILYNNAGVAKDGLDFFLTIEVYE